MRRLRFRARARQDLLNIAGYIAPDNPARARSYVRELRERCGDLREYPKRGPKRDDIAAGVRVLRVDSYLILYRIETDAVIILRIVHGKRLLNTLSLNGDT